MAKKKALRTFFRDIKTLPSHLWTRADFGYEVQETDGEPSSYRCAIGHLVLLNGGYFDGDGQLTTPQDDQAFTQFIETQYDVDSNLIREVININDSSLTFEEVKNRLKSHEKEERQVRKFLSSNR